VRPEATALRDAWNEDESHGLGFPMSPLGVRFRMLEETLQIVHEMWQGEHGSQKAFDGVQYQVAEGSYDQVGNRTSSPGQQLVLEALSEPGLVLVGGPVRDVRKLRIDLRQRQRIEDGRRVRWVDPR
jgi:hypothetical protein